MSKRGSQGRYDNLNSINEEDEEEAANRPQPADRERYAERERERDAKHSSGLDAGREFSDPVTSGT